MVGGGQAAGGDSAQRSHGGARPSRALDGLVALALAGLAALLGLLAGGDGDDRGCLLLRRYGGTA